MPSKLNSKLSVKKLNEISEKIVDTINLAELKKNKPYRLIEFKHTKTVNGDTALATLEDRDEVFEVFLPKRFSSIPDDDNVKGVLMIYEEQEVLRNGMVCNNIRL